MFSLFKKKPTAPVYEFENHKVIGVSFKNEDGTSRQSILKKMKDKKKPFDNPDIVLNRYLYEGKDAIGVFVNGVQIGHISKYSVKHVLDNINRTQGVSKFNVYGGYDKEDDEDRYYGIEITLALLKMNSDNKK